MTFQVTINNEADIAGLSANMVRKAISERSAMLAAVFGEAAEDGGYNHAKVTSREFKDGVDFATWTRKVNDELTKLGEKQKEFTQLEMAAKNAGEWKSWAGKNRSLDDHAPDGEEKKRPSSMQLDEIGSGFVKSEAFKRIKQREPGKAELAVDAKSFLERKATFLTSAGWAPESTRTGRVVMNAQRGIEVTDILPVFPTSQAAIKYMEETTFTNNAAERAENAAYVESALALTERSVTVRSVGTSIPVTDEQLEDEEGVAAYLDQRLGFMVRQRLDTQILAGGGTPPDLLGTMNVGSTQSQAKGADPVPDAIHKAITKVQVTGRANPNVVILHPNDWQDIRLLRTTDGIYIWGSPSESGPAMIWGLPIVSTSAATENTGIVGDYANYSGLHIRKGLEVASGYVNDDFLDGRVTLRAGLRAAVVHYRPAAFCLVTGI